LVSCPDIPDGHFFKDPYGSQSSPDFLIEYEGNLISLECKSSKSWKPMWNNNLPFIDSIYLVGNISKEEVILFLGQDTLSMEERLYHLSILDNINKSNEDYKKVCRSKGYKYYVYLRQQFNQFSGFTDDNGSFLKNRLSVLNFINKIKR
jgi:hypothetical protein